MDLPEYRLPKDLWCNPLPLEHYPCAMLAPGRYGSASFADGFIGPVRDFREMSDPEVLYDDGTLCSRADYTGNKRELLIDFRTVAPVRARFVRLDLTPPHTPGLRRGVNNFTVFGFFDGTN